MARVSWPDASDIETTRAVPSAGPPTGPGKWVVAADFETGLTLGPVVAAGGIQALITVSMFIKHPTRFAHAQSSNGSCCAIVGATGGAPGNYGDLTRYRTDLIATRTSEKRRVEELLEASQIRA